MDVSEPMDLTTSANRIAVLNTTVETSVAETVSVPLNVGVGVSIVNVENGFDQGSPEFRQHICITIEDSPIKEEVKEEADAHANVN